jgi:hypothetical protein
MQELPHNSTVAASADFSGTADPHTGGTAAAQAVSKDRRFGLAVRYVRSNRFAEAQRVYEAIVRDRPRDERARTALARLGISLERADVIKQAMAEPSVLPPTIIDACVSGLLKANEVQALQDFVLQHPELAAKYTPRIVRHLRELARAATTKKDVAANYRCLLAVEPDDPAAKAAIARLFQPEIEMCRTLSGPVLIKAATAILHADPKIAIVARMKAQACFDEGLFDDAQATLAALDDADLIHGRTLTLYLSSLQRLENLLIQARGIERVSRHRGTNDVAVLRAARNGLKAAAAAADQAAVAIFCDIVLSFEPADSFSLRLAPRAAAALNRQLISAIRSGDVAVVENLLTLHPSRLSEPSRRAGQRFISRMSRRAVRAGQLA